MMERDLARMSEEWWARVKADDALLVKWLRNQFHSEDTAAELIERFRDDYPDQTGWRPVLTTIAGQERVHASLIGELLRARGQTPQRLERKERYWDETLPGVHDFQSGAAAAAYAEIASLARIRVIVADPDTPADVRAAYARILPDEKFHACAFARMAGERAMEEARERHLRGIARLRPEGVEAA